VQGCSNVSLCESGSKFGNRIKRLSIVIEVSHPQKKKEVSEKDLPIPFGCYSEKESKTRETIHFIEYKCYILEKFKNYPPTSDAIQSSHLEIPYSFIIYMGKVPFWVIAQNILCHINWLMPSVTIMPSAVISSAVTKLHLKLKLH
jgi:hypothetical protein